MPTEFESVPEHLRTDFDIFDESMAQPVDRVQDILAEMAQKSPIYFSSKYGGHWVVLGYEEVHQVMRDPYTFSSYPNNLVPHGAGKFLPLELDPPEHTLYRHALQPLFNPKRMAALEPNIRRIVNELIDGFAHRGEAEFVSEFAHELPARVFLALMDWPLEDADFFTHATDVTLHGVPGGTEEESHAARMQAGVDMFTYYSKVVADRRARGPEADDITSQIVHQSIGTGDEERPLTDEELANMFFLLCIAGLHTVQGTLGWSMMHLSENPDERKKLVEDPSLIPAAVEEMLRMEGAVSAGRRATKDTEIAGQPIQEGDRVLVVLSAANRDDSEFDAPDVVRITREPNRHLSFGAGPHRCLGSHLARVEIRIALEELHRRIPDYRIDPSKPSVFNAGQVRGVVTLPVLFTPEQVPAGASA
ncbi:cytochrome P450 [Sporichthya brevicatena]|uniref:Cytochrome P450 n=1 Tax=Sporichthya brevicatena TaxID=171442 RepID=A0ABN1H6I8_9ACTN